MQRMVITLCDKPLSLKRFNKSISRKAGKSRLRRVSFAIEGEGVECGGVNIHRIEPFNELKNSEQ
jgi:hypothetical protein